MSLRKLATRNVVTITPTATIEDAAKMMRSFHVGNVVVIKTEGNKIMPVGILTDRDIVVSVVAFGIDASNIRVQDVMNPALITARTNDSFYHLLNVMKEHGIKRVPLLNEGDSLEGIISSDDIAEMLAAELGDLAKITEKQRNVEVERRRKFA